MSAALTLEPVCCPLCCADDADHILTGPDRVHGVPGQFRLVRCRNCRLVYQNPRPTAESFAAIYPPDYGPYQVEPITPGRIPPDITRAAQLIHRRQPGGGQMLDIGCGPGLFLQAMRLLHPHWSLGGVEPDPQAAAQALAAGLQIQCCPVKQAVLADAGYDAVTLWNVIEHLPDPGEMLRRAHRLLQPSGYLYLAVPLLDSWDARIFGHYWIGWELPRHFTHFDRRTLARLLAETGFQLTATACTNGRSYGFTASLRLLIQERVRSFPLRRLGEALTYSRPLALAILPYTLLAIAMRCCTVLTIAARRI